MMKRHAAALAEMVGELWPPEMVAKTNPLAEATSLVIVEIGCYKGDTSKVLIDMFPRIELHMIDPWMAWDNKTPFPQWGGNLWRKSQDWWDGVAYEAIDKTEHGNRHVHRMTSLEASREFEDRSVDVVFIDAGHDLDEVLNDIELWTPKIKGAGLLCGHDCGERGNLGWDGKAGVRRRVVNKLAYHVAGPARQGDRLMIYWDARVWGQIIR